MIETLLQPPLLLAGAAVLTAVAAILRVERRPKLPTSQEAVNWEGIANRAMTALDDERTEHSRQLSKVLREQAIDGERLTICEERWQLVAPLLKTWANGQSLQNQIVDRINDLTNRAEELKQSKEGGE